MRRIIFFIHNHKKLTGVFIVLGIVLVELWKINAHFHFVDTSLIVNTLWYLSGFATVLLLALIALSGLIVFWFLFVAPEHKIPPWFEPWKRFLRPEKPVGEDEKKVRSKKIFAISAGIFICLNLILIPIAYLTSEVWNNLHISTIIMLDLLALILLFMRLWLVVGIMVFVMTITLGGIGVYETLYPPLPPQPPAMDTDTNKQLSQTKIQAESKATTPPKKAVGLSQAPKTHIKFNGMGWNNVFLLVASAKPHKHTFKKVPLVFGIDCSEARTDVWVIPGPGKMQYRCGKDKKFIGWGEDYPALKQVAYFTKVKGISSKIRIYVRY